MNEINHIGQMVICVRERWHQIKPELYASLQKRGMTNMPKLNGIYTVDGFRFDESGRTFIVLREIQYTHCVLAFCVTEFRPLKNKYVEEIISKYTKQPEEA